MFAPRQSYLPRAPYNWQHFSEKLRDLAQKRQPMTNPVQPTLNTPPVPNGQLAVVVGAGGGLGTAVAQQFIAQGYSVVTASRSSEPPCHGATWHCPCDYSDDGIAELVNGVSALLTEHPLSLARLVICNGVLHNERIRPERTMKRLQRAAMVEVLETNAVVPTLCLGAFTDLLVKAPAPKVAVFSARVGSISDNRLGGWHSYRASKAALNMLLKCAAIELQRLNPKAAVLAFHPGTVDTAISKPFQRGVPEGKLFSPDFVASRLLTLLDTLPEGHELAYLDWDGKPIEW